MKHNGNKESTVAAKMFEKCLSACASGKKQKYTCIGAQESCHS